MCFVYCRKNYVDQAVDGRVKDVIGNCDVCRNVGKVTTFDAVHLRKPKLYRTQDSKRGCTLYNKNKNMFP
jgi:hypothetical protein